MNQQNQQNGPSYAEASSFAKASANESEGRQIQIKASDEKLKGEYSNVMQILHTKEEFLLDFLNVFPPTGTLNSRVIVAPGHFKRMIGAMSENLKKYEEKFGKVEESEDLGQKSFGFQG